MTMPLKDIANKYDPKKNMYKNNKTDTCLSMFTPKKHTIHQVDSFKEASQGIKYSSPKVSTRDHISDPTMWEIYDDKELAPVVDEYQSADEEFESFLKGLDDNPVGSPCISSVGSPNDSLDDPNEDLIDFSLEEELIELEKSMLVMETGVDNKDLCGEVEDVKPSVLSTDDVIKLLDATIEENTIMPTLEETKSTIEDAETTVKGLDCVNIEPFKSDNVYDEHTQSGELKDCSDTCVTTTSCEDCRPNLVHSTDNENPLMVCKTVKSNILSTKPNNDPLTTVIPTVENRLVPVDELNKSTIVDLMDFTTNTNIEKDNPLIVCPEDVVNDSKFTIIDLSLSDESDTETVDAIVINEPPCDVIKETTKPNSFICIDLTYSPSRISCVEDDKATNDVLVEDTLKSNSFGSLVKDINCENSKGLKLDCNANTDHKYKIKINMSEVKKAGNNSLILNSSVDSKDLSGAPYCLDNILKTWRPKSMTSKDLFLVLDECGEISDNEISSYHSKSTIVSSSQNSDSVLEKINLTQERPKSVACLSPLPKPCKGIDECSNRAEKLLLAEVPEMSHQEPSIEDILLIDTDNDISIEENVNESSTGDKTPELLVKCDTDCLSKVIELAQIKEVITRELPAPPVIEKSVALVKSESEDYVSNDPQENADNNNPDWELLRKLETDEERYKAVRQRWRNLIIPNPNQNLTYRHRRFKEATTNPSSTVTSDMSCTSFKSRVEIKGSRKRTLSVDPDVLCYAPKAKRARTQSCTASYDRKVEAVQKDAEVEKARLKNEHKVAMVELHCKQELEQMQLINCQPWGYTMYLNQLYLKQAEDVQKLQEWYTGARNAVQSASQNKLNVLRKAIEEVRIFHSFYQGLDTKENKDCLLLSDIELEDLLEEDKLYEEYSHFYK